MSAGPGGPADGLRLRVRFRFRSDTGEVEVFTVEAVNADAVAEGHDARHERAARALAGVVERQPVLEEIEGGPAAARAALPESDAGAPTDEADQDAADREGERVGE